MPYSGKQWLVQKWSKPGGTTEVKTDNSLREAIKEAEQQIKDSLIETYIIYQKVELNWVEIPMVEVYQYLEEQEREDQNGVKDAL